jgi:hypothetical protein
VPPPLPAWLVLGTVGLGPGPQAREEPALGSLPLARTAEAFAEFRAACARDGGALWGRELFGPVLLVDPASRALAANLPDEEGRLVEQTGLFVGTLPAHLPIANAPVEWAGRRWAMALAPFLGATTPERVTLLVHESFHCVQQELGLYVFGGENEHLDTLEGRLWLQLEWNALQAALTSSSEGRTALVQDALDFRAARRALYAEAAARENPLELREGLASYTGLVLAGRSAEEVVADCAARRACEDNLNRSFAYTSGSLYGYLLDRATPTWRAQLRGTSDLGAVLAQALDLRPSAERAAARAEVHGGVALRARELEREQARQQRLAHFRKVLVEGPVLVLDLSLVTSAAMDTRKVFPFGPGQTVYTARRLVARFGTLEITEAAILEDSSARRGRLSLIDAAADRLSGPGWTLALAEGFELVPGERAGDWSVRPRE